MTIKFYTSFEFSLKIFSPVQFEIECIISISSQYMKIMRFCLYLEMYVMMPAEYRKNSKIWDTSNNCHNCPKNRKVQCSIVLMHPKDADGMANSVDPDQTASSEAV